MQFHQILVGINAVVALLGASLLGHSYFLSPSTLEVTNQDSHRSLRAFERDLADYKTVTFKPTEAHHMPDNLAMAPATTKYVYSAPPLQVAPYSIEDLVEVSSIFLKTFGILVYDPEGDDFLFLYNDKRHRWTPSCSKLVWSFRMFTTMLRGGFPERFRGRESPELGKSS
jgi:hypothetical protein